MEETKLYTISAFSENNVGVLNQVTIIFTRRCINIESISASATAIPGVYKITVVAKSTLSAMEKVVKQIEKRIEIIKAFLHTDDEIIYQEVALYKVPTDKMLHESHLEGIIRHHNARILEITPDYTILEKTGHVDETEALFAELRRYGILQFVRSGRAAVTKHPVEFVTNYLEQQAKIHPEWKKFVDGL
ncbi:MAG: acetolactate synthase small subunit [Muribaculaceae bacterium]|nr:acetolactate synthase small subunit [Muribaculaceae bacterium]MDE7393605.1 acetolactate synthase small subunit [Muribaculaceae bacterium]